MNSRDALGIYCENIEEFSHRQRIADTQRTNTVTELLSVLVAQASDTNVKELFRKFKKMVPASTAEDRARLCAEIGASSRFGAEMRRKSFFGEDIAAGLHGRVSLVRNSYNELAFSRLSCFITRAKKSSAPSFSSACEDVYDGRCEFCILPIESSQSGRLFGFYSMLDRYELKICAVCELDSEDGADGNVRYALVGRTLPDRIPKNSRWCFEFSVISEDGRIFSDISRVSEIFEARLIKIDSLPVEYDGGLQKYYFTFYLPERSIAAFDLFLTEEYARYTAVGRYPTI